MKMKIHNVPAWARKRVKIVYTIVDGEAWFYDAHDDDERAMEQAWEIDGYAVKTAYVAEEGEP